MHHYGSWLKKKVLHLVGFMRMRRQHRVTWLTLPNYSHTA